jgi:penicillin-binding protein 1A
LKKENPEDLALNSSDINLSEADLNKLDSLANEDFPAPGVLKAKEPVPAAPTAIKTPATPEDLDGLDALNALDNLEALNNLDNLDAPNDPNARADLKAHKDPKEESLAADLDKVADLDPLGLASGDLEPNDPAPVRKKPAPRLKRSRVRGPDQAPPPKPVKKSLLGRLVRAAAWGALSCAILGLTVLFLGYAYLSQDLPSVEVLKNYQPKTVTFFYSSDGEIIGEYSHERRLVRPLSEIPLIVRQAFIAVEDANFYQHGGVNVLAMARAAYHNLVSDNLQGASTITQQVVRSFFLSREKKLVRKLREIILAFRLEGALSKDEILYLYLNQIYLGQGAYGVEAAAETYFDKTVDRLTVAEAAMLAGITQSPEGKNPLRQPQEARARQVYGIKRMVAVGFITPQQGDAALDEILNLVGERPNPNLTAAPYFTEHVRRILAEQYGEESLYNDGWRVFTTLDARAQKAADLAVARGLWEYQRRRGFKGPINHLTEREIAPFIQQKTKDFPPDGLSPERLNQAVILAKDDQGVDIAVGPYPGRITLKNLEWIGKPKVKTLARGDVIWVRTDPSGPSLTPSATDKSQALASVASQAAGEGPIRPFILENRSDVQAALLSMDLATGGVVAMVGGRDFRESQFNRATQSQRQPGSSFKPIVYAAAMDNGFTPGSVLIDGPVVIDDQWTGRRWKPVNSDHKFLGPMTLYSALVASRNLVSIKILERIGFEALDKTASDLGITTKLPHSPPVALGAHGVVMPEMLSAYSAFANQGQRVEPRYINRIEDRHGRVVATFEPTFHEAISPGTACEITWMLRGVVAQGTGTSVKPLKRPVAGKTGTTNDASDAWFVGFTPEIATAVWMGTDELKPRAVGEVGGRAAGPIFLYYNQEVLKDKPIVDFQVPKDAQLAAGGAFGICYKAGTIGQGISETQMTASLEEDFLRADMGEGSGDPLAQLDPAQAPEETFLEEETRP